MAGRRQGIDPSWSDLLSRTPQQTGASNMNCRGGNPPRRCRRRRVGGWRLPPGAVIVDRTSRWGNPHTVAAAAAAGHSDPQQAAVDAFGRWLDGDLAQPDVYARGRRTFDRRWVLAHLHELTGRDLYCPCVEGTPCHGDELIRRANPRGDRMCADALGPWTAPGLTD